MKRLFLGAGEGDSGAWVFGNRKINSCYLIYIHILIFFTRKTIAYTPTKTRGQDLHGQKADHANGAGSFTRYLLFITLAIALIAVPAVSADIQNDSVQQQPLPRSCRSVYMSLISAGSAWQKDRLKRTFT
jgi:hypothetical protein